MGLVLLLNFLISASADNSAADYIATGYKGEWYSRAFSSFWSWKSFTDALINSLLKFIIIEKDNSYGVMLKTEFGEEFRTPYLAHFDPATGEISGTLNYSLPNGDGKVFSGKVLINGQSNISKFVNLKNYINKSIKDLILYGITNKLTVSFVGNKSKTTVSVHPNSTVELPRVIINYEKFKQGDTSPIPMNYEAQEINNTNPINETVETPTQVLSNVGGDTNQSTAKIENKTNGTAGENLSIINPKPSEDVGIFINETKGFSIENSNYDSVKWYLDEIEVKKDSKFYDFKGLKKGFYTLNVEVKKDSKTSNHFWNIEVKEKEVKKEEKKGLGIWFWIIIIILMFIIIAAALYFLKIRSKPNNLVGVNTPDNNSIVTNQGSNN